MIDKALEVAGSQKDRMNGNCPSLTNLRIRIILRRHSRGYPIYRSGRRISCLLMKKRCSDFI